MNLPTSSINYQKDFIEYIHEGTVVPVISNSFHLEQIFRGDSELSTATTDPPQFYDEVRTIDQALTKKWAEEVVNYPMSDNHNLARVAQYYQVISEDFEQAKKDYLKFLNDQLLRANQGRGGYEDIVGQYKRSSQRLIFSRLVKELDLPAFPEGKADPLRLLAKLPLPIYITTSYFRFIEEALKKEDKKPSTLYWSWSGGKMNVKLEHFPDPDSSEEAAPVNPRDYVPTPTRPVVYHLFGLENFARTLVLSEEDYMNFLMNFAESLGRLEVIPSPLLEALSEKRLLLLGYHLQDWDFRALFRFISKFRNRGPEAISPSIAIQLMPSLRDKGFEGKSLSYLEKYFKDYRFNVKWINTEQFIYELMDSWNGGSED